SPELLRGAANGDATAVDTFCRAQHPEVYRLCLGFLACAAEAEDAAQEAILRLLDRLSQCDPTRPFTTWRNRVVLNLCRDRLRRAARRRVAESRSAEQRAGSGAASDAGFDALDRAELQQLLTRALRILPQREREAVVLRDLEGNDVDDVASAMGISPSTVRSLTTLARRRLRELLVGTTGHEAVPEARDV
ncbi:MAG: sigma-70 family RNA polymerase sigma factor, partial [Planctomycetes bacterium]|nr:sigma-70 family RNA polymerase sigma factor [Planctomycetota bacterium]